PHYSDAWREVFFFSSRRRHTRSKRDWSSDVCSSDLVLMVRVTQVNAAALDGELLPQPVHRDGRALHMPARPPRAEWGIPLRLPGAVGPPQECVQRVALPLPLRVATALGEELAHGGLVVTGLVAKLLGVSVVGVDNRVLHIPDVCRHIILQRPDYLNPHNDHFHTTSDVS